MKAILFYFSGIAVKLKSCVFTTMFTQDLLYTLLYQIVQYTIK